MAVTVMHAVTLRNCQKLEEHGPKAVLGDFAGEVLMSLCGMVHESRYAPERCPECVELFDKEGDEEFCSWCAIERFQAEEAK